MRKEELIQRSPVRGFEKIIHGELKAGESGVVASPSGLGKTSVLVQIALDKLMQGKKVIQVSFIQQKSYVLSWYEDIFAEFIHKKNLEDASGVRESISRNRVLLNFNQDGVTSDSIRGSLRALIVDGGFRADAIIIDGFDFTRADSERIAKLRAFAGEVGASLWYSCNVNDNAHITGGLPAVLAPFSEVLDVVIALESRPECIELSVLKNRGAPVSGGAVLKLDPKSLLILEAA